MNTLEEAIYQYSKENADMILSEAQVKTLSAYTEYMLDENEKYNLTAIRDPEKAALLHIADSLTISQYIPSGTLCDVGAGAGFPSLPLAICRRDLQVTAVDATQKKVNFMNSAAQLTGLDNFQARNGRAEELFAYGAALRESFDYVTARAVASLGVLCELCVPALKVGGLFVAMKGESAGAEEQACAAHAKELHQKLGIQLESVNSLQLRGFGETFERNIFVFRKVAPVVPALPRSFANMKKKPLF